MKKLTEIIHRGVEDTPKNMWPTYDGKNLDRAAFVTASEIGYCARRIRFGKEAAKVDSASKEKEHWGFFERGHNVEAWAVEKLDLGCDDSVTFTHTGKQQVSLYAGAQSGTPDGIMHTDEGAIVLDIKSIDPRTNLKFLPKQAHVDQVMQNMDLVAHCLEYPVIGGKLLYIGASDYQAMQEYDLEIDNERMTYLEERANTILGAETANDVEPEGIYAHNGCQYCTFTTKCNAAQEVKRNEQKEANAQKALASNHFK